MIFQGLAYNKSYILKYGSGATFTNIDYFPGKAVFIYIDFWKIHETGLESSYKAENKCPWVFSHAESIFDNLWTPGTIK